MEAFFLLGIRMAHASSSVAQTFPEQFIKNDFGE